MPGGSAQGREADGSVCFCQQKTDSPNIEERGPCSSFLGVKGGREGGGPDPGRLFRALWDCSRGT